MSEGSRGEGEGRPPLLTEGRKSAFRQKAGWKLGDLLAARRGECKSKRSVRALCGGFGQGHRHRSYGYVACTHKFTVQDMGVKFTRELQSTDIKSYNSVAATDGA